MQKPILATWAFNQNFGDMLTWWFLRRHGVARVDPGHAAPHILGVGSILSWSSPQSIVMGSGIGNADDRVEKPLEVHLVRGPLSAAKLGYTGVIGDPCLALPYLVEPAKERHGVGVIPHYVDTPHLAFHESVTVIDIMAPVKEVIATVTSCECVVSSSLHGLILADAYGIPCELARSPRLCGDGSKFEDHFLAVGGDRGIPLAVESLSDTADHLRSRITGRSPRFSSQDILKAVLAAIHSLEDKSNV